MYALFAETAAEKACAMVGATDWRGLLYGELLLVVTVTAGLGFGKLLLAASVPERVMRYLLPGADARRGRGGLHPDLLFALAVSLGSSRAGAALVAEAQREGRLSRREAVFGTLLQSFPGYIKRWLISFPTAFGLAGAAGAIYSLIVLLRSFCRFLFFLALLRKGPSRDLPQGEASGVSHPPFVPGESATLPGAEPGREDGASAKIRDSILPQQTHEREAVAQGPAGGVHGNRGRALPLFRTLARTLPLACSVYALAYLLSPSIQAFLQEKGASFPLLSSAGWTVAAASFAHVNAALGVAGGAIASGALSTAQGVLALLVGNMLAVLSRVLRQDLAFWLGIFPGRMVRSLFVWNLVTLVFTMAVTVALAAIPVLGGW